ncbi:hypothetical protein KP509_13G040200 [Ceratopteris richardii]|uniref:Uncharacterized protein n=2 Tax=Ceratopteris richardii TaxID=49495 RepID=A0A8T2TIC5_CERRI|nr:hypothetical protein KP509_13G040200 [Ceratopteris richardii]
MDTVGSHLELSRIYALFHVEPFFTSKSLSTCSSLAGMELLKFPSLWKSHRTVAVPLCIADYKKKNRLGAVKIQKDMFDENISVPKIPSTEEVNQESEDSGLVPKEWRNIQDNLNKTRKERKIDVRLRAEEAAQKRAEELVLKRQNLEEAGRLLKAREHSRISSNQVQDMNELEGGSTIFNAEYTYLKEEMASLATYEVSDIVVQDESGKSHHISQKESNPKIDLIFNVDEMACLKRSTPDFTRIHCEKWLPLQALVSAGQFFYLDEYLKSPNLDLDAADEDGYTPIHRAILGRKETAVTQLLRAGADPSILDKDSASYLHYSVQTGSLNLVRLFVKYGVDMDHADEDGWTALHVAALTSQEYIVRHLLFSGANKHLKNKDGHTPFDLCLAVGKGYRTFAVAKNLKRLP